MHRRRDRLVRLRRHLADRQRARRAQRPAAGCLVTAGALTPGRGCCGSLAQFDRSLLGADPRRRPGPAGRPADRDPHRRRRRAGRRAAPDRAGPARRRAGPAGRAGHEPRRGRASSSTRDPAAARALLARGAGDVRATALPSCATWSAASTRRCWPTAASATRCGRWRWTRRVPIDGRRRPARPAAARRWSRPPTSRSPRRWPTRPSTPARRHGLRSTCGTPTALLRIAVADDGGGGADPARGTGLRGIERRLGAFDGILAVSSPPGGPTIVDHGGAVRVVIAEDLFLLRDGLVRLLEAHGFEVVAAVDTGPALLRALLEHRPDVAVVDVRLPPTFTDEGLQAALAARRAGARPAGAGAVPVRRAALRPRAARRPAAAASATCSRTGSSTSASSSTRSAGSPAGGTVMDPEVIATAAGPPRRRRPAGAR